MCSNTCSPLAEVCRAIEELAGGAGGDDVAARLAEAWARIADADPEVARRVSEYLKTAEQRRSDSRGSDSLSDCGQAGRSDRQYPP